MAKIKLSLPKEYVEYENEAALKRDLCAFLEANKIFYWKNHTTGVRGRKLGKNDGRGSSDILFMYNGRFGAVEAKMPKGKLSEEQRIFLQLVKENGGIAIVAKSVEDLQRGLFN